MSLLYRIDFPLNGKDNTLGIRAVGRGRSTPRTPNGTIKQPLSYIQLTGVSHIELLEKAREHTHIHKNILPFVCIHCMSVSKSNRAMRHWEIQSLRSTRGDGNTFLLLFLYYSHFLIYICIHTVCCMPLFLTHSLFFLSPNWLCLCVLVNLQHHDSCHSRLLSHLHIILVHEPTKTLLKTISFIHMLFNMYKFYWHETWLQLLLLTIDQTERIGLQLLALWCPIW